MNKGITVDVEGIDTVQAHLKDITDKIRGIVEDELDDLGTNTVAQAKRLAPVNLGKLWNSISYDRKGLVVEVIVASDYAAYVEFGTRKFAEETVNKLPPDWQTFAAQFKGPGGGSFAQLVERITQWVKDKGFAAQLTKSGNRSKSKASIEQEEQAAYAIARGIMINGIKAHPFLYPSVRDNLKIFQDNLRKKIEG